MKILMSMDDAKNEKPRARSDYCEFEFEFEQTLSGVYENEGRNETSRASDRGFA